jgi:hypothetical protein
MTAGDHIIGTEQVHLTQMTLRRFIELHRLRMDVEWADSNPSMSDNDWSQSANHYLCKLRCERRRMTVHFSQGPALTKEPALAEVLDCLSSDAVSVENSRSFEDWCAELGYDTDSRKAERTFEACKRQSSQLRRLLGDEAYSILLWKTDRL